MARRIEDYAIIADTQAAALVSRDGSIDWLCLPRFDSGACFAALLGDEGNGHWRIAPAGGVNQVRRRYRRLALILREHQGVTGRLALVGWCSVIHSPTRIIAAPMIRFQVSRSSTKAIPSNTATIGVR